MAKKTYLQKTLTALAGEFLVAGQLCLRGYIASLTLKNYPGVDVFVYNPKAKKQIALQVKALNAPTNFYWISKIVETPFAFVYINEDFSTEYFIVPLDEVKSISEKDTKGYDSAHPGWKWIDLDSIRPYKDRWDLLGLD